jgi:hypothetical protein
MRRKLVTIFCAVISVLLLETAYAQSPTPVAATQTAAVPAAVATNNASMQATMKSLRELKAANEQILKKQQATLEALDELQKAADQIKIFSKRG